MASLRSPHNDSRTYLANRSAIWFLVLVAALSLTGFAQNQQVALGTQQVEPSADNNNSGNAEAFPVIAAYSTQISSLSVFVDGPNSASSAWVGIYSNYYGHPYALLTQAAISPVSAGKWNSVTVPSINVTQGKKYWVAVLGLGGQIAFRDTGGNCNSETSQQTTLSSLPSTWRTGSRWPTCVVSMFGSGSTSSSISVGVTPSSTSLSAGQQQQFNATVAGTTNTSVTWKTSGGTVSSSGLYTAPSSAGTYTVTATSVADSTKSASASVTVSQPATVSVSISPTTANLNTGTQQQFAATVTGSTNTSVTWKASGGTVSSSGLYTAPSSAGTFTVTATSVADPTKSASTSVTVSQPAVSVSISVSPTAASLNTGAQQQFTAYVSGTSNTAVTWSTTGGTVSTSGLYTAPSTAGNYSVTSVSQADPTKSASASVTVAAPQPISVSVSPLSVSMPQQWTQQFKATVTGTTNTAVTWSVTQGTGTITQTGLFTAPQSVEADTVTAVSQADNTKSGSASVSVAAPHAVSLSWSASSSSGISYYKVYRGSVNGGPYTLVKSNIGSTSYTDSNVQSGTTYYYVTTAVDSSGMESTYSTPAQAVIPMP